MSVVSIFKESQSDFRTGQGTATGTPTPIGEGSVNKFIVVRTDAEATITVAPNKGDGFTVADGEQTPPIYISDLGKVYVSGTGGFSWIAQ